jgi:hypothetical protein
MTLDARKLCFTSTAAFRRLLEILIREVKMQKG